MIICLKLYQILLRILHALGMKLLIFELSLFTVPTA